MIWDSFRRHSHRPVAKSPRVAGGVSAVDELTGKRLEMVKNQLVSRGISDQAVLSAMSDVPRHKFLDADQYAEAYEDHPLAIGEGQTISQPYVVAFMVQAAHLGPQSRVLEIGTGSGYQAAVASKIAAEVVTLEIVPELAQRAAANFERLGLGNIVLYQTDGYGGFPRLAPYEAILVAAAPKALPPALVGQLKIGARLVIPIGEGIQEIVVITRHETGYSSEAVLPVRFVPMTGLAEGA